MQIRTNLATRTYIDKKKLSGALLGSMAVLIMLLLVQIKICAFNSGEISRLNAMKISMESRYKRKHVDISDKDYKKLTGDIKFVNGILERKAFDWVGLLSKLESVVPDGLTLSSVQPNSGDRTLRLTGVSVNFITLRHFLENLEGSSFFTDVFLYNQNDTKVAGDPKALSFTISCKFSF